tara:strand:- start:1577 stop:2140 length:564 start_codon:yes stop_codon:yes gene_type:complete
MRIISGYFKGKKITEPKDKETRPLKDLTKESIFNIINHSNKFDVKLENSIVLDLFSGVGSFGLECLSRGAQHVTFVENYSGVLPILKRNLNNLKIEKNYEIIEKNLFDNFNLKFLEKKFDIIFLDPPYKEKKLDFIIDNISENKLLSKSGIIIIHRHKKEDGKFSKNLKIFEEKKYGISKIFFGTLN